MFFVLGFLSSLSFSSSTPTVLPTATEDHHGSLTIFGREPPACIDPQRYRTTQEIVWSCLATIIACAWVAVHPNLPGPYDSRWVKFHRRVTIMMYAIMVPEGMAVWALAQWRAARKIAKEFNEKNGRNDPAYQVFAGPAWYTPRGLYNWLFGPCPRPSNRWTLTHGFFVQMGGFMLYREDTPIRVLTIDDLQAMIDRGLVDAPTIREDEIEDKSKGDFFTKLFVLLQTSWFVFQCLARWTLGLPITELEVVTLAFGTLNVITYSLWWKKPQNILVDIAVPLKSDVDDGFPMTDSDREITAGGLYGPGGEKESWVFRKIKERGGWLKWVIAIPLFVVGALRPPAKMSGFKGTNGVLRGALRVPMFYTAEAKGDEWSLFLLLGPLFGALHFIPWAASFPSPVELWLWRSSALVIYIEPHIPGLFIPLAFIYKLNKNHLDKPLVKWFISPLTNGMIYSVIIITALGLLLYLIARLVLLMVAFTTLRALPEGAHTTIQWTTFFPHI